jgi:hypothetical protein
MRQEPAQPREVSGGNCKKQPLPRPPRQRRVDRGIGGLDLGRIGAHDPDRDRAGRREEIGNGRQLNQSPLPRARAI